MNKTLKKLTGLTVGLALLFGFNIATSHEKQSKSVEPVSASVGNYSRNLSTYYTSAFSHKVTSSSYGSSLLSTLHELMYDSHGTYNTYDDLWTYTKYTDYDIDNPDNIILVYSRQSVNGTQNANVWNREHVWCKSLSGGLYKDVSGSTTGAGSDLHHLRPASTAYNSTRGNVPYGIVDSHTSSTQMGDTDCYMTNASFEPPDYLKGDVARILMYTYTHYSSEISGTSTKSGSLSITNIVNANNAQSAWDLLMDWNEIDPVDYSEIVRNNQCAVYLGNFNPFIDHPEFARMIWDDTSSQQAGLFFTTSYKEVNVSATTTNTAAVYGNVSSSESIVYTSDNPNVATVSSNGTITGVSNGVARIKARAKINGISKISYCFVKVGSGYTPKYTERASGIVYTPTSSSTAVASEKLASETVSYSNTFGGASQITSGNTITLTINNFPKTIKSIILYMHSNSNGGAGSLSITVGGSTYKTISNSNFNSSSWHGSYTQTFVPVDVTNSSASKKTGTIAITISCTTNSLFLQKAIIDYTERTVTQASSIQITPSSIQLTPGEDNFLTTSFTPPSTTLQTVTWSSANTSIATVNKYGLLRAIAVGTTTITATAKDGSGAAGTMTVEVVDEAGGDDPGESGVTSVTVSPSTLNLDLNGNTSGTLTATVIADQGIATTLSWESSNPSVASVTNAGVVTASAVGTTTVKATSTVDSTKFSSCAVTVIDSSSGGGGGLSDDFALYSGALTEGNYLVVYSNSAMNSTVTSNRLMYEEVTPSNDVITTDDTSIIWHIAASGNYWTLYNEAEGKYAASNGTKNQATTSSTDDDKILWTVTGTSTYEFVNKYNSGNSVNANLRKNGTYGFACYSTSTGGALSLYKQQESTKTLSSISLNTDNVTKTFNVGATFSYTGLVVTANYSDGTSATVTPSSVSSPNMSTAGQKTVTVFYTEGGETKQASYNITVTADPTLTWTAPTINTYSGSTLEVANANGWSVTYNNGSGSITNPTYGQFSVKLGGATISLPYTWQPGDDGKTLCVSYNSLTTSTTTVSIVQSLRPVMVETPGESSDSNLTFTGACGGSGTADDGKAWTVTSDGTESNYDSTKGIHYGTSGAAVTYIKLTSTAFTSGTISKVVVQASTASGVSATVSVKVGGSAFGGDAQSLTTSNASYTFNGSASAGTIEVLITKPTSATKAIYCKGIAVTYQTSTVTKDIANEVGHEDAQRAVVKFAKAFNAALGGTSYCTTNLSSAWSTASSAWTTFLSEASAAPNEGEAYAKSLIANATAQWTEGTDSDYSYCLERCLATYEKCVTVHGQTAFMSEVRSVSSSNHVSPIVILTSKTNSIAVIVIISMVSMTAIGGYFFLRRRKEN